MTTLLTSAWQPPLMQGLKAGGLMNEALDNEKTFRQGRHHFMTSVNQILECSLSLEQTARCLQAMNVNFSSIMFWNIAKFIVPMGAALLASRQIKIWRISEAANSIQTQIGKFSLTVMIVSTVALFLLGQSVLAASALIYLGIGLLDRRNVFPQPLQSALHVANFYIGNFAGIYLGGNIIRLICTMNLILPLVKQIIEHQATAAMKRSQLAACDPSLANDSQNTLDQKTTISLSELTNFNPTAQCGLRKSHIHIAPLPSVRDDVSIDDILTLCNKIDWTQHEHVIKGKLSTDKRWLEVGQFENIMPIDYFKRNLKSLVDDIKNKNILQGKPENYDMLDYYCRYIAQEIENQDELSQTDMLLLIGIEGGEYCGTGKFGVVEEAYQNILSQSSGLPLAARIFANLQLERQRLCQALYLHLWKTNPLVQFVGYLSEINSVHNMNLFTNFVQGGKRFGIPHQAAKNDSTALFNPLTHYMAYSIIHKMDDYFWKGVIFPQCFFTFQAPLGSDWWKAWKWVHVKNDPVVIHPYDENAIMDRMNEIIGTPLIPKTDIYIWWMEWVERQMNLSDIQKEALIEELQAIPQKDLNGNFLSLTFNGEPFEIDDKIQPKFIKLMLIEMGVFDKPLIFEKDLMAEHQISSFESGDFSPRPLPSINIPINNHEWDIPFES